ncbi:hypothetical protein EVAR_93405_1 [Eumeta japonica]|uniref:Uncharacterized protein n=1 Tax=Eumeta variegata TaxID=151549 RepID=A0A4C1UPT8_EUMVA|nr:hypothetical protein EVAR_93405_1 [Eumeta japonica]
MIERQRTESICEKAYTKTLLKVDQTEYHRVDGDSRRSRGKIGARIGFTTTAKERHLGSDHPETGDTGVLWTHPQGHTFKLDKYKEISVSQLPVWHLAAEGRALTPRSADNACDLAGGRATRQHSIHDRHSATFFREAISCLPPLQLADPVCHIG